MSNLKPTAFKCRNCGQCCRAETVEGKQKFGLRFFDFEAKLLKKKANDLGIEARFVPLLVLSDRRNKKNIVFLYEFGHLECPFLKENKCLVYEDRSLICRSFPVFSTGLVGKDASLIKSSQCLSQQEMSKLFGDKDSLGTAVAKAIAAFGDCYLSCFLFESINRDEQNVLKLLKERGIIDVAEEDAGYTEIDFSDFLIEQGLSATSPDALIQEIKTLAQTRKKMQEILERYGQ